MSPSSFGKTTWFFGTTFWFFWLLFYALLFFYNCNSKYASSSSSPGISKSLQSYSSIFVAVRLDVRLYFTFWNEELPYPEASVTFFFYVMLCAWGFFTGTFELVVGKLFNWLLSDFLWSSGLSFVLLLFIRIRTFEIYIYLYYKNYNNISIRLI